MKSLTSSNLPMKNNLIILEKVSTRPRIKSLQEQVNNSTLVKPKETEKFFEDKSSDKNQNKDCELFKKTKNKKRLAKCRCEELRSCFNVTRNEVSCKLREKNQRYP